MFFWLKLKFKKANDEEKSKKIYFFIVFIKKHLIF